MSQIVQHLNLEIQKCISTAKEANIAVALTSTFGVDVLSSAPKGCSVRIITGVNLPTPTDVLNNLRDSYGSKARVYLQPRTFYHPKVYLITNNDDSLVAFIGSGNFTSGGLKDNIELSYKVTNQEECQELLKWFNSIYEQAEEITDSFLKEYRTYYAKWQSVKKEQSSDIEEIQNKLNTIRANTDAIKKELIKLRASADYTNMVKARKKDVKDIRAAIDYKNNFKDFDVDAFLGILPLGHVIPTYKQSQIKAVKNGKMQKLCHMLCDDSISIEERYRLAVTDYKVAGCGCNVITKILCVHKPKEYMLWNSVSKGFMDYTQVSFDRGTKEWNQYKQLCQLFKHLCQEIDIEDFAVLDELLYRAMEEVDLK